MYVKFEFVLSLTLSAYGYRKDIAGRKNRSFGNWGKISRPLKERWVAAAVGCLSNNGMLRLFEDWYSSAKEDC